METKVCCVTGHRDIPTDRAVYVEQALRREVLAAIEDGYTRFISGFAEGTDLMFAAIVAEQKEYSPNLYLEAALPYAGRIKTKASNFTICCESAMRSRSYAKNIPLHALCRETGIWPRSLSV